MNAIFGPCIGKTVKSMTSSGIVFTDGTTLTWHTGGDIGADGGWYTYLYIDINGKQVVRM